MGNFIEMQYNNIISSVRVTLSLVTIKGINKIGKFKSTSKLHLTE